MINKTLISNWSVTTCCMLAISITILYILMALEYITHQKMVSDVMIIAAVLVSITAGSIFFGARLVGKDSPEKKRTIYFLQNTLRYFLAFIFFYYAFSGLYGTLFDLSLHTLHSPVYRLSGPELASRFFGYSHFNIILICLSQLLCSMLLFYRRTTLAACVFGLCMMLGITVISFTHHFPLKFLTAIYTLMLLYFILLQFDRVKAFIFQGKIILLNRLPIYLTQDRHNFLPVILVKFFFTIALLICCFKEWKMKDDHSSTNPLVGIWQFTSPAEGHFMNAQTIIFDKGGEGSLDQFVRVNHFTYDTDSTNKQVLIWGMPVTADTIKAVYRFVSTDNMELTISDNVIAKLKKEY